jgi:DinB superfamily
MDTTLKTILWGQFGAAIDMLSNAMQECPDSLWRERLWNHPNEPAGFSEFWYLAYHALFWLDFYLSGSVEGYAPPAPFTLSEFDSAGFPDKVYSKDELQTYLVYCRKKCQTTIENLTDEKASQLCKFGHREFSFAELLLYNMRHVQEHAAQLNLILGQSGIAVTGWVGKAKK